MKRGEEERAAGKQGNKQGKKQGKKGKGRTLESFFDPS